MVVRSIGIESQKSGFSWTIVTDTQGYLVCEKSANIEFPRNLNRPEGLAWLYDEVRDMLSHTSADGAALKRAESGRSMSNAILERAEVDGVLQLVFAIQSIELRTYQWKSLASFFGKKSRESVFDLLDSMEVAVTVPKARYGSLAVALSSLDS
jgi:Holliday junction resolvasome RuvABC endonuclease subunit